MKKLFQIIFLLFIGCSVAFSQTNPNPYDFGKMWTFENPPKEWFKKEYKFEPGDAWFDDVRKASLRFATWCSASFISPDGLIMTNHHCSRDVVADLQKSGENFDKQGFYAASLADERKAEGLFVEQLIQVAEITKEVQTFVGSVAEDKKAEATKKALEEIQKKYAALPQWEGLRLQLVTYYSGGKYSLYGYKRFDDIRLVWIPEVDLGFFGGDPDNFTYPRYNLDVTFWRAYDANGLPMNTSANYLPFNPMGAAEDEAVFVVGNPGRTERYRTVSQLEFDRDHRYQLSYKFLKNRNDLMMEEYNAIANDPTKEMESQALLNEIAGVANSMKAYGGIVKGLKDPELFGRKVEMEKYIKSKSGGLTYWDDLKAEYDKLNIHGWAISHLSPSALRSEIYAALYTLNGYYTSDKKDDKAKATIAKLPSLLQDQKARKIFKIFLMEISEDAHPQDKTITTLLGKRTVDQYLNYLYQSSDLADAKKAEKCLDKLDDKKYAKSDDPLFALAKTLSARYQEAGKMFQASSARRSELEAKIANQAFAVYGDNLPPDATFTLRISDGRVKAYDYNGTTAPPFTTYFGLYDRFYSHGQKFPWTLPAKWQNPPMELLKSPFNMVSTNDIIGGNSGSPLINAKKQAVGLIFDGNIESLPGNFIFDEELNRTVSVHAGGIYAALKHIYKADRIIAELDKK